MVCLRLKIWEQRETAKKTEWVLTVSYMFHGEDKAEAKAREKAHRDFDKYHAAAMSYERTIGSVRLRSHLGWLC